MDPTPLKSHVHGALVGLAAGDLAGAGVSQGLDAGARQTPHIASRLSAARGPHTATTTWALTLVDSFLYRRDATALQDDLALRLRILVGPCRGRALRGRQQGLAGTLAQVGASLERDADPRLCGVDDVLADALPAIVPLALALKDPANEVARALVDIVMLTHRNVRIVSAAGAFVFGVRSWITEGEAPLAQHLDAARAGSAHALAALQEHRPSLGKGSATEATGALAIALATAAAGAPEALLAPPGYDGRDAPERLVAAALITPSLAPASLAALVTERQDGGGDSDVTLPLLLAARGAALGAESLPLALTSRLTTREMVEQRAGALLDAAPPALPALVEEELHISLAARAAPDDGDHGDREEEAVPSKPARSRQRADRDQLCLL